MSADERRWQRERDIEAMKRYAELQTNPARRRAAENALRKEVQAAQRVLGGKKG